ncbi:MAG: V-type ATP synthase subunit C [Tissierellia bacterium]|nr:V-type ATP synthase subunit C [Tissierellia bacterium]MDD4725407.1 V-type ATP synthase subunit C [Tissierellia bacterium]
MDRMEFIHGVTRTKVLETKLLSRAKIDRIVDAKDIDDALKVLNETEYSNSFSGLSDANDYEKVLSNELVRIYDLMRDVSADPVVVDLLALKYDYHNLKVLVKENEYNKDFSHLYVSVGSVDYKKIKQAYIEQDFDEIPIEFETAINAAVTDLQETKDPQKIDLIFDKYYFEHLYNMANETKVELFINYVKDLIDFTNVKSAIRLKKQNKEFKFYNDVILENGNIEKEEILSTFSDSIDDMINRFKNTKISASLIMGLDSYKETGRLSDFEKYMDDYLMELNKESKQINFGPEPIFSYIIAKETEIKTLRIILVAKLNNLSPEVIREKVRELYV